MSLIILHGNGLSAISQKLSLIKKDFDPLSIVELNGKSLSFDKALMEVSTPSLFAEKRLVILEDLEGVDLTNLDPDENTTVVLKFSKALIKTSTILKQAASKKAQVFLLTEQEEASIFPFLDLLAEKNPQALKEIEYRLKEHGSQYLLTMMSFMLRRLIQKPKGNLPPFVLKKIESQKRNFPLEKIKQCYLALIETDFKIKSGLINEKNGLTLLVNKILTT